PGAVPLEHGPAADLARVFKALGDPARVKLFSLIVGSQAGEMCLCDLTEPIGLSQPTVSHHMKLLVDAGLVTREKRGRWSYYATTPGPLLDAVRFLAGMDDDGRSTVERVTAGEHR